MVVKTKVAEWLPYKIYPFSLQTGPWNHVMPQRSGYSDMNTVRATLNLDYSRMVQKERHTVYAEILAVFKFSRYFAVSMNPRKLKSRNIFSISVKESSLEATSIFAAVTIFSLCLVKFRLFSFVPVRSFFQQVQPGARPIMTAWLAQNSNPNEYYSCYSGNQCHAFRLSISSLLGIKVGFIRTVYCKRCEKLFYST